ncbi:hypothetical protein ACFYT4_09835 [Streptomyces sp. NPDC004609]|uniref:hypothetical protein n=1 Tax=Streptomyces sp. NPDC004609 TaxID=3364704 RepID=UPI0036976793
MTAQTYDHHGDGQELIPRPDRTVHALRAALGVLAPMRLPEMETDERAAIAQALKLDDLAPLRLFVMKWAAEIEIARIPDLVQRYQRYQYLANSAETPEESRPHVRAVSDIVSDAYKAVEG